MSELRFSGDLDFSGFILTYTGGRGDVAMLDTAFPGEPQNASYEWKVRVVNETTRQVAILRPVLSADVPQLWVISKVFEMIASGPAVWNDLIPIDDPRLQ